MEGAQFGDRPPRGVRLAGHSGGDAHVEEADAGHGLFADVQRLRLHAAAAAGDPGVVRARNDDLVELFLLAEGVVGDHVRSVCASRCRAGG